MRIPNYNTLADAIDRLIVEVSKLAFFENAKRQEHDREVPDKYLIAHWDKLSRDACEYRDLLKREIDSIMQKICETKRYEILPAARTFSSPPKTAADLIAERVCFTGSEEFKKELSDSIERELKE